MSTIDCITDESSKEGKFPGYCEARNTHRWEAHCAGVSQLSCYATLIEGLTSIFTCCATKHEGELFVFFFFLLFFTVFYSVCGCSHTQPPPLDYPSAKFKAEDCLNTHIEGVGYMRTGDQKVIGTKVIVGKLILWLPNSSDWLLPLLNCCIMWSAVQSNMLNFHSALGFSQIWNWILRLGKLLVQRCLKMLQPTLRKW